MRRTHGYRLAATIIGFAGTLQADTITVCLDGSCDFTDPAAATQVAVSGDIIEIGPGTYLLEETVIIYGQNLEVHGAVDVDGRPATILDGQGVITVLNTLALTDQTLIENLVITNGVAEYGAGMFLFNSDPVFRNCIIRDNHAEIEGGGLFMNHDSQPTMISCEITGNTAQHPKWDNLGRGAAVMISKGTLTLVDSIVSKNVAAVAGGGINYNSEGTVVLERSRICGNVAPDSPQVYGAGTVIDLGGCIENDCDLCVTADPADLNFDGLVDGADMTILLGAWGGTGPGDFDHNGIVDGGDLSRLLGSWG